MAKILTVTPNPALDTYTETEKLFDDKKMYCAQQQFYPGGGGINISRVIQRLGGQTDAVVFVGGDSGEMLCSLLAKENVTFYAVRSKEKTREVFNVFVNESEKIYRFVTPGGPINSEFEDKMLSEIKKVVSNYDFVVASGSLPPNCSPNFYTKVANLVHGKKVKFVLDTSGEALALGREGYPYILRMNSKEFEWLKDYYKASKLTDIEFEQSLIEENICEVVVRTLGAEGAIWVDKSNRYHVKPPRIKVKSSIGAGDSFLAALLLSLTDGMSALESLRRGMAAAAATLITPGTELCRREDFERLINEIKDVN